MNNLLAKLPEDLSGKTVVIAGGADESGRKITLAIAGMGANIILLGDKQNEVDETMDTIRRLAPERHHYGMKADPSNPQDIQIILTVIDRQFHYVDVLIYNNTFTFPQHAGDPDLLNQALTAKIKGQYFCTREIMERMDSVPSTGYIFNINTMGAEFRRKYRKLSSQARTAFREFNTNLCREAADKDVKVMLLSM